MFKVALETLEKGVKYVNIKTPERHQWLNDVVLVSLLLTLIMVYTFFCVSIIS